MAPGAIVAIFGTNLAEGQQSANAPLPFTLGGTSVTINGVPAPLTFVSPAQINAQVPSSLPVPGPNSFIAAVSVVVTNSAGSSAPALVGLVAGNPGIFSADASGCGLAAALNIRPDGTVSRNSPSNSAAVGDYVALFGTGFGLAAQLVPSCPKPPSTSGRARCPGIHPPVQFRFGSAALKTPLETRDRAWPAQITPD